MANTNVIPEPYFHMEEFLRKLNDFKNSKSITYIWRHVSRDSGVSIHTLKMILKGKQPSLENIIKLCNLMGENLYDFIEYTNDKSFKPITCK